MLDYVSDILSFWMSVDTPRFIRFFWYFVLFDFSRYIVFDFVILYFNYLQSQKSKDKVLNARKRLLFENPLVSIIVPGRNEALHLPTLAASLKCQTYKNTEVIIVDDGSVDDTQRVCNELAGMNMIDKFFRNRERGGKASAANLALRYCKGKYIVHLDADSYMNDDLIVNLILPFYYKRNVGAVAGDVRVHNIHDDLSTSLQAIEYMKKISIGRRVMSFLHIVRVVPGACGAFRKDLLDRIGGWDVGPGLDGDVTIKIRKLGFRIFFEPAAVCYTNVPDSFAKLCRQRYRWDRSLIRFRLRKHIDILLPTENFNILNFLSSAENIFFNLVLNINWWIYLFDVLFNYTHISKYILPMNLILYAGMNLFQFLVGMFLYEPAARKKMFPLIIYFPLIPLYSGFFLRIIRTYAYFSEWFFKTSYKDDWNPVRVSLKARENRL